MNRYVAVETAISVIINVALSIGFALLVFGRQPAIDLGGRTVLLDMLPQGFMIAFMATLVPTLLTRRRLSTGTVAAVPGPHRLPRHPMVRASLAGAGAALAGTGLLALLGPAIVVTVPAFLALKAGYGALLALLVTPVALRAALRDPVRRHFG